MVDLLLLLIPALSSRLVGGKKKHLKETKEVVFPAETHHRSLVGTSLFVYRCVNLTGAYYFTSGENYMFSVEKRTHKKKKMFFFSERSS